MTPLSDDRACSARTAKLAGRLAAVSSVVCRPGAALAPLTTLRIGGPAELLVEVGSEAALAAAVRAAQELALPCFLLGLGSNVLVPDEGIRGVVLRLTGAFRRAAVRGERVSAGGAALLPRLARRAAERGLGGLEPFAGFPSTVGGAVFMNAGCYGTEICDLLLSVRLVERDGTRRRVTAAELAPSYRHTSLGDRGAIVTRAHFRLAPTPPEVALARIAELGAKRLAALPSGLPNAGSVFRNPAGDSAGRLLDAAGCKGRVVGGARVSEKHANVLVNAGGATAADMFALMIAMREAVEERFAIRLEPEWVLAGDLHERWCESRMPDQKAGGAASMPRIL